MNDDKLTYGEACCLVLGLSPSNENRKKAKAYFETSLLDVCYVVSLGAMRPIAIGEDVMERNSFTFQSYTNTRPSSSKEVLRDSENPPDDDQIDLVTEMPASSVLHVLKQNVSTIEPENKERYENLFVCKDILKEILKKYFEEAYISLPQVDQWLSSDGSFGRSIQLSLEGIKKRGLWLWVLKKEYRICMKVYASYKLHIQKSNIVSIGYVRKSHSNESHSTRVRLLQQMVNKLRSRCLAWTVYCSPRCNASMNLEKRDLNSSINNVLKELNHCAGIMQDLIRRLTTNTEPIRLIVLDYAGLSTDFGDIQALFEKYEQIVEIIVDLVFGFDLISRQDILNDNGISSKFNCRVGSKKRCYGMTSFNLLS